MRSPMSVSKRKLTSLFSNRKPFDSVQRWVSRVVWGRWALGFFFWEGTGDLRWTPWKTLSETIWDVEREYPGTRDAVFGLLLGLAIHLRYKVKLQDALEWGLTREGLDGALLADVETWVAARQRT